MGPTEAILKLSRDRKLREGGSVVATTASETTTNCGLKLQRCVDRFHFFRLNAQVRQCLLLTGVPKGLHQARNRRVLFGAPHVTPGFAECVTAEVSFEVYLAAPVFDQVIERRHDQRSIGPLAGEQISVFIHPRQVPHRDRFLLELVE